MSSWNKIRANRLVDHIDRLVTIIEKKQQGYREIIKEQIKHE